MNHWSIGYFSKPQHGQSDVDVLCFENFHEFPECPISQQIPESKRDPPSDSPASTKGSTAVPCVSRRSIAKSDFSVRIWPSMTCFQEKRSENKKCNWCSYEIWSLIIQFVVSGIGGKTRRSSGSWKAKTSRGFQQQTTWVIKCGINLYQDISKKF